MAPPAPIRRRRRRATDSISLPRGERVAKQGEEVDGEKGEEIEFEEEKEGLREKDEEK